MPEPLQAPTKIWVLITDRKISTPLGITPPSQTRTVEDVLGYPPYRLDSRLACTEPQVTIQPVAVQVRRARTEHR